jgi:tetratricopeptide (TPR) repeat protein
MEPERLDLQEPTVLEPSRTDVELARKNDEELQAIGTAAYAAGDHSLAANAFSRIVDLFPRSRHRPAALLQSAHSYRALGEWRAALERFQVVKRENAPLDAIEAGFRVAECQYNLGDPDAALAELSALADRSDLSPALRVRALDQRGIVEMETGDLQSAEGSLEAAMATWQGARDQERIDPHHAAEAMFYLGEIRRTRFQSLTLDPLQQEDDSLAEALERKAQLLLAAQDRYLQAARMRDPEVIVAAGSRIASLYDELYTQLVRAPLPRGLSDQEQAAYRRELNIRVRALVVKAIQSYTETLVFAQRAGVSNNLVQASQESLERMQEALHEIDADPAGASGAVSGYDSSP